jgi:hypothetical protein
MLKDSLPNYIVDSIMINHLKQKFEREWIEPDGRFSDSFFEALAKNSGENMRNLVDIIENEEEKRLYKLYQKIKIKNEFKKLTRNYVKDSKEVNKRTMKSNKKDRKFLRVLVDNVDRVMYNLSRDIEEGKVEQGDNEEKITQVEKVATQRVTNSQKEYDPALPLIMEVYPDEKNHYLILKDSISLREKFMDLRRSMVKKTRKSRKETHEEVKDDKKNSVITKKVVARRTRQQKKDGLNASINKLAVCIKKKRGHRPDNYTGIGDQMKQEVNNKLANKNMDLIPIDSKDERAKSAKVEKKGTKPLSKWRYGEVAEKLTEKIDREKPKEINNNENDVIDIDASGEDVEMEKEIVPIVKINKESHENRDYKGYTENDQKEKKKKMMEAANLSLVQVKRLKEANTILPDVNGRHFRKVVMMRNQIYICRDEVDNTRRYNPILNDEKTIVKYYRNNQLVIVFLTGNIIGSIA